MAFWIKLFFNLPGVRLIFKPLFRIILGALAIPLIRMFLRKVLKINLINEELEKDVTQWFRASLLLLIATYNMEPILFNTVPPKFRGEGDYEGVMLGLRLMMAIGCIEAMPDQELFSIIHPGPPKIPFKNIKQYVSEFREKFWQIIKGFACTHLARSSPVLVILAVCYPGVIGWVCYGLGLFQYLLIALVTSRDKAMDVLAQVDEKLKQKRAELAQEYMG